MTAHQELIQTNTVKSSYIEWKCPAPDVWGRLPCQMQFCWRFLKIYGDFPVKKEDERMIKSKKIIGKIMFCVLAVGMLFFMKESIFAETRNQNGFLVDEAKEDPLYEKYHSSMQLMSGGSKYTIAQAKKKITHQSGFSSKYEKIYGIDVSKWQEEIDWEKAKADGVEFAVIRLGYRGMANGALALDPYFEKNIKGAHEAGVDVGIYFFTQALNTTEAKEEAKFCLKYLSDYKSYVTYPVIIDLEPCGGRLDKANLSKSKKTAICETFCTTVEAAGYTGGIYCSKSMFLTWVDIASLEKEHYVWLAHYTDSTNYERRFDMWQFSSSCSVKGISGNVDMDVAYNLKTPAAPTNLNQTEIAEDSLTFTWNNVVGADGYRVYQYDKNDNRENTYSTTEQSVTISGLSEGHTYRYKVRSYYTGADGTRKYSKYSPLFLASTKSAQVSGIVTDSRTENSVTVAWDGQSNAEGYRVRLYNREDQSYETVAHVQTTSCEIPDLVEAKGYDVVVQAYIKLNGVTKNYGPYSEIATVYTTTKTVTGVKLSALTKTTMSVSWKKQSKADGYRVAWYDAKGKQIDYAETTDTTWTIRRLSTGTDYRVKVRSFYLNDKNSKILGSYSAASKITTLPSKVGKVKKLSVTTQSLQLSWKEKKGADGYKIYRYDSAAKAYKKIKTTTQTNYTMKKLRAATKYKIMVVAYVTNGTKNYLAEESDVYQFVTRPAEVRKLKQTAKTKSTATVSWKKTARASGYQVKIYNKKKKLIGTYLTAKTTWKFKKLSGSYTVKVRAYAKSANATSYGESYARCTVSTKK